MTSIEPCPIIKLLTDTESSCAFFAGPLGWGYDKVMNEALLLVGSSTGLGLLR